MLMVFMEVILMDKYVHLQLVDLIILLLILLKEKLVV